MSSIADWPVRERPRERILSDGPERLTDAELLALLIRSGHGGRSAVEIGRTLLARHGSLRALLASPAGGVQSSGLGPAAWCALQAGLELTRRSLLEALVGSDVMSSPEQVRQYLALWLRDRPYECFCALFLDSQNRLVRAEQLFRGTLTQTAVYPREVARRALELNAAALVLAHNHPSGVAEPSHADRLLTDALRGALSQLDIPVLDHLIVAGNRCVSFAERGWL